MVRRNEESNDWALISLGSRSLVPLVPPPIVLVALLVAAGFRDKKRETDEGLLAGKEPCEARRLRNFLDSGDDWCWCSF